MHLLLPWIGALVAIFLLTVLVWRPDRRLFADTLAGSQLAFVIAIVLGQLLSAWTWQQIVKYRIARSLPTAHCHLPLKAQ
jgi:hypothetical protein